jgi:peptide/nickel transport system substrate-binding protein/microcin C transport system substrate-binding protein
MEGRGWEKVKKVKVENSTGKGYGFFGPNLQRPLFQDVRVRRALAHSLNRPFMNEKFRFNMSDLQAGPIYGRSPYASPKIKPIGFDLEEAKRLLKAAGWDDSDKSGLLDKIIDGKKVEFRFSLMNPNPDFEKYLTVYKEDLRKIGVELNIQQVEWNSLMKAVDEKNFDMVAMAWSGVVEYDPKQIWHSESSRKGGSNFIGYRNPEVDKVIELARKTMDRKKRIELMNRFSELVAADAPYIFLFSERYDKYAHNERVEKIKDTFKFTTGFDFMWIK